MIGPDVFLVTHEIVLLPCHLRDFAVLGRASTVYQTRRHTETTLKSAFLPFLMGHVAEQRGRFENRAAVKFERFGSPSTRDRSTWRFA